MQVFLNHIGLSFLLHIAPSSSGHPAAVADYGGASDHGGHRRDRLPVDFTMALHVTVAAKLLHAYITWERFLAGVRPLVCLEVAKLGE
jgi:hypothetical protein